MPAKDPPTSTTADRILDLAERLAQTRGFNGFSYADISAELGITKASLHYHFRTKADLGRRLIDRYHVNFVTALAAIDARGEPAAQRLREYAELYARVMRVERICLCGMFAAEFSTLPPPMQEGIRAFFDMNEAWLASTLAEGRSTNSLRFDGTPAEVARHLLGALEGAMLVAHSYADAARFDRSAQRLIDELEMERG